MENTELYLYINAIKELLDADHKYGAGFYNCDEWIVAYKKLHDLIGYKLPTSVRSEDEV
jgi:hypothetical protein